VTATEVLTTLRDFRLIARVLFANLVLVPLLGLLIVWSLPLSRAEAAAILLLAFIPGGLNAIQFTDKVKGHEGHAVAILFLLTIVAFIVALPLAAGFLPGQAPSVPPYGRGIRALFLFLLLPLLVGAELRHGVPKIAHALYKPMLLLSNISFVISVFLPMAIKQQAARAIGVQALLAMILLIVGGMVIGWLLGGPTPERRRVLAIATNTRNAPVCLVLAIAGFRSPLVATVVLAYMLLMVPPNLLLTLYFTIKNRRRARAQ